MQVTFHFVAPSVSFSVRKRFQDTAHILAYSVEYSVSYDTRLRLHPVRYFLSELYTTTAPLDSM